MRYLADLYIYFAGPHAYQQIRDGFSALCCAEKTDCITGGGRVRALDTIDNAHHFVRRALHLGLYLDRQRETQIAQDRGESYPDRTALGNMTSYAYPDVVAGSAEYRGKKGAGARIMVRTGSWRINGARALFGWSRKTFQRRSESAAFWVRGLAECWQISRTTVPQKLVEIFFDFLHGHRGHFLDQIDELLGSHVADFVMENGLHGLFPLRKWRLPRWRIIQRIRSTVLR